MKLYISLCLNLFAAASSIVEATPKMLRGGGSSLDSSDGADSRDARELTDMAILCTKNKTKQVGTEMGQLFAVEAHRRL